MKKLIIFFSWSTLILAGEYDRYISRLNLNATQGNEVKTTLIQALEEKEEAIQEIRETKGIFKKIPLMKGISKRDKEINKELKNHLSEEQLIEWNKIQKDIKEESMNKG